MANEKSETKQKIDLNAKVDFTGFTKTAEEIMDAAMGNDLQFESVLQLQEGEGIEGTFVEYEMYDKVEPNGTVVELCRAVVACVDEKRGLTVNFKVSMGKNMEPQMLRAVPGKPITIARVTPPDEIKKAPGFLKNLKMYVVGTPAAPQGSIAPGRTSEHPTMAAKRKKAEIAMHMKRMEQLSDKSE